MGRLQWVRKSLLDNAPNRSLGALSKRDTYYIIGILVKPEINFPFSLILALTANGTTYKWGSKTCVKSTKDVPALPEDAEEIRY